jgi:hypothetical protein
MAGRYCLPLWHQPLWWRSGRYVALLSAIAEEPLTLERCSFLETRYPLEMANRFRSSDPRLDAIAPLALRSLQMCAHETYMDRPYYEQMTYVGDTRLAALTTYTISRDDRLPRKALLLYGLSRLPAGLTQARYPSRDVQVIPPFALWWVGMVHDYAVWRSDRAFVAGLLPGVQAVLDGFLAYVDAGDLLQAPGGVEFRRLDRSIVCSIRGRRFIRGWGCGLTFRRKVSRPRPSSRNPRVPTVTAGVRIRFITSSPRCSASVRPHRGLRKSRSGPCRGT